VVVDIGAERIAIAAERGSEKIALEVQSFINLSQVRDLEQAVGQYEGYRIILREREPERQLYLAPTQLMREFRQTKSGTAQACRLQAKQRFARPGRRTTTACVD